MIKGVTRLTRNNRITLPRSVVQEMDLKEGDEIVMTMADDCLEIRAARECSISSRN